MSDNERPLPQSVSGDSLDGRQASETDEYIEDLNKPQQVVATGEVIRSWPAKLIQSLTTAKNKIKIYEKEIVNLGNEIKVLKKNNAGLADQISVLEKQKTDIQNKYTDLNDTLDQIQLQDELLSLSVSGDPLDSLDGPQASGTHEYTLQRQVSENKRLNEEICTLNVRVHDLETENGQLKENLKIYAQKLQKCASEKCLVSCTKDVYFSILNNDFNKSICREMFCTVMHDKLKEKHAHDVPLSCMTFAQQLQSLNFVKKVYDKRDIKNGEHEKVLQNCVEKLEGVPGMLLYSGESDVGHCVKVAGKGPDVAPFFDVQQKKSWDDWEEKDVCNVDVWKINETELFKNIVSTAQDNDKVALTQKKKYFGQEQSVEEGT